MTRAISNALILLVSAILIMTLIAVNAAFLVVMLRRLNPRHALPAD